MEYPGFNEMADYVRPNFNTQAGIQFQPMTPGPRSVSDLHNEAKERFVGIIFMEKDPNRSTKDYFVEYDSWEKYSETKHYNKRPYLAVHKGTNKNYVNYLCILTKNGVDKYYVVSKRIPTELESLEKYCSCIKCKACVFNPFKYLWCNCCTGCIKAGTGFVNEKFVAKAKEAKLLEEKRKTVTVKKANSLFNQIDKINLVKCAEIFIIVSLMAIPFSYLA